MTRKERLERTIRGQEVDRPPVCFYEINGLTQNEHDTDAFNIYSDPSWKPLLALTREKSDRIVNASVAMRGTSHDPLAERTTVDVRIEGDERLATKTIRTDGRVLTESSRRHKDIDTVWVTEHLLKNVDDLKAYLSLPESPIDGTPDIAPVLAMEKSLGDSGIVMLNTADPLCMAAALFPMDEYTVIAMTEPSLFRSLLDRCARMIYPRIAATVRALPGRLWRIYGPEYASEPYLPPSLFRDYVTGYDTEIVRLIQETGGIARIHSHGNLANVLHHIAATGADALDPIEPPPQGDVSLAAVRKRYPSMTLFGNLEVSDMETLRRDEFIPKVHAALDEGDTLDSRFVLMPSACPYGRALPQRTLGNYEAIIHIMEERYAANR
ncbi:MAG: uroporphyrinogen decarboxylase family protein [Spirochaetota bacterium]